MSDVGDGTFQAQLAPEELRRVLEAAFGPGKAPRVERLEGGFSNSLFRITFPDRAGSFVLRLYRRGEQVAAIEAALLERLRERVPAPEVVYADPGGTLTGRPLIITRYVEGILLDRVLAEGRIDDVAGAARAAGAALAALGQVTFRRDGFFAGPELEPTGEPRMRGEDLLAFVDAHLFEGPGRAALDEETRQQYRQLVREAAPRIDAVAGGRSLVHADFNGKNILLVPAAGRWQVSAVLDWEFAFAGSPLFDIGNMLRFSHLMPPSFEPSFLAGFVAHGGSLPPDWDQVARLLDVFPLCQFLAHGRDVPFLGQVRGIVSRCVERGWI